MSSRLPPMAVVGAAAVSSFGFDWWGLGRAVKNGRLSLTASDALRSSHPALLASEVPEISSSLDAADPRTLKLMSRAARLAATAVKLALQHAGWETEREEVGFFCGVGASGGSMTVLSEMLAASIEDRQFSLRRFGTEGLNAGNPLFAFQLMNNFTLCHAAILSGVAGPNSAFFSRGNGTVAALVEAAYALSQGDCERALAGGADSALHPVTWAELVRSGCSSAGYVPGEGAGILALTRHAEAPLAILEHAEFHGSGGGLGDLVTIVLQTLEASSIDLVVMAPWGTITKAALSRAIKALLPHATVVDTSASLGDALAATPALAWIVALDLIVAGEAKRALVLNAGTDGGLGAVLFRRAL